MNTIITGATGSIGHALISTLIKKNYKVTILLNPYSKRSKILKTKYADVKFVNCCLNKYHEFNSQDNYDVFIHMAWQGGGDRDNISININSLLMSVEAVKLAKRLNVKTFLGVGSQSEYGITKLPINEKLVCKPNTAFGTSKLASYNLTRIECDRLNIKHIWLRVGSGYGEYDRSSSMISKTIENLKNGILPKFTTGEQYWDFIHTKDIAAAIELLISSSSHEGLFVIGSGTKKYLKDYLLIIAEEAKFNIDDCLGKVKILNTTTTNLIIDDKKIRKCLNWEPKIVFREGIKKLLL